MGKTPGKGGARFDGQLLGYLDYDWHFAKIGWC
jgi:hypothetical protein